MKRVFALILALILCMSLLPFAAMAEENPLPQEEEEQQENTLTEENGLPEEGENEEDEVPEVPAEELTGQGEVPSNAVAEASEEEEANGEKGLFSEETDRDTDLVVEGEEEETEPETAAKDGESKDGGPSGTCGLNGDNIAWELSSDYKTLTLSGSGAMANFANVKAEPWYNYRTYITQVVISEGITTLGNNSFNQCSSLPSVTLPSTLTSIGNSVFRKCSLLSSISIPNSVTSIGYGVFYECSILSSVTLPNTLTNIESQAFYNCLKLTSITLPATVTTIAGNAFEGCSDLSSITLPSGLTSLGGSAFKNCSSLAGTVTIPGTVTSIGGDTFYGCKKIENVIVENGVTSLPNNMFYNCSGLITVSLPESLTSIGSNCFYQCNYMTTINLPSNLASVGGSAFYRCSSLESVTIPASLTSAYNAFSECMIKTVVFEEGCTTVASSMFKTCVMLQSLTLASTITTIGATAFDGCKMLPNVTLPESLTSMGEGAFSGCTAMTEFIIPAGLTSLPKSMIRNCTGITQIVIPSTVTSIGDFAFSGTGLINVVIPDSVTSIGSYVFDSCASLESVLLSENITGIWQQAFANCPNLTSITLPAGITTIGNSAFQNCTGLTEITIPDGVTKLDNYAFQGSGIHEITIPDSVTLIGTYAFDSCGSLTDVYYKGTEAQWNAIEIHLLNDSLDNAVKHFMAGILYPVAVYSTNTSCTASVANISISPEDTSFPFDTSVTVTAGQAGGYSFVGWYPVVSVSGGQVTGYENTCLATTLNYTFNVREGQQLAAVYSANSNASVTIHPLNGAAFSIDGVEYSAEQTLSVPLSSTLTITAKEADRVLQWENRSHKLLGTGSSLTLSVVSSNDIYLVYKGEESASGSYVRFVSEFGQVVAEAWYNTNSTVTLPDGPSRFGYNFEYWVFDGTETEATAAAIQAKIGVDSVITLKPYYTQDSTSYTVTVNFRNAGGASIGSGSTAYTEIPIGTVYTVSAPQIQGYLFSCWKDASGETVLGYNTEYNLLVSTDVTVTACYAMEQTQAQPVITLSELYTITSGSTHRVSCAATRSIPDGYTLVEHGILFAKNYSGTTDDFIFGTEGVRKSVSSDTAMNGVFKVNVKVSDDSAVIFFRGYLILRNDSTGNTETVYTGIASGSYANLPH